MTQFTPICVFIVWYCSGYKILFFLSWTVANIYQQNKFFVANFKSVSTEVGIIGLDRMVFSSLILTCCLTQNSCQFIKKVEEYSLSVLHSLNANVPLMQNSCPFVNKKKCQKRFVLTTFQISLSKNYCLPYENNARYGRIPVCLKNTENLMV